MAVQPRQGILWVIAAPSGAGKSTLVNKLVAADGRLKLSVSHTTRAPRNNEVDGVHYHFVDYAAFMELVEADQFFEYAHVHGDMKGTSVTGVMPMLDNGFDVVLEIDYQGAEQVRKKVPQCQSVFILPPSRNELERRLRARATDSEEAIAMRLENARIEIAHATEFDYLVINDDLAKALADLQAIVRAEHLRTDAQKLNQQGLLADLVRSGKIDARS